jgi:RNA polymerase sigma-70 factor (sigma-E family)
MRLATVRSVDRADPPDGAAAWPENVARCFASSGKVGRSVSFEATVDDGRDFEVFFARYQRDLARLAFVYVGDHAAADEVAADALVAAWEHWERVCASDHPVAYVRRMVINLSISKVRGRMRESRRLRALVTGVEHQARAVDTAAVIDVQTALNELPPGRRACIVLRYAFDLSESEVAETLQISVGTVKSQTSRAASQLRAVLGQFRADSTSVIEVEADPDDAVRVKSRRR